MRYFKYFIISLLCLSWTQPLQAHINPDLSGGVATTDSQAASYREDCANAQSQIDLEVNNVQARLLVGGDIWWDGDAGLYVVPKVADGATTEPVSSLFAGAVWIGGLDPGGSLKLAAQTYGTASGASDFWPGPLTEIGTIGKDTCSDWDRFFTVSGANIDQHIIAWQAALDAGETEIAVDDIPEDILGWPANANPFFFDIAGFDLPLRPIQGMAPFYDENANNTYEPHLGDYPIIEIRGCEEATPQYGDQMIFWIYNDAGNIHTETGGDAIQMEVQVEAFGYATNDEVNDMTFYRYKLINWAIESIDSTYFAMWIDPDLGCYLDDYVGCDTSLNLMYVYNSDGLDGESSCQDCQGVATYCEDIPVLGVDYFRGPRGPKMFINGVDDSDGLRNPNIGEIGDTIIELGMTAFTYYNNGGTNPTPPPGTTDPSSAPQYYNYLSGSWTDGTRFTYGGDAYNPMSTDYINYAFTEEPNDINGWSMESEGLPNGDRRTIQASGPFRLEPSAKNELIIGVVWIPNVDHPAPSMTRLFTADEVAQALFDNCFNITDGPDAPDMCFIELDEEIIMTLSNEQTSNNFEGEYQEIDLRAPPMLPDSVKSYFFEGYKLFQLSAPNIGDYDNPDEARLIYQVDIKNDVATVYNWVPSEVENPIPGGQPIFVPVEEVDGANSGVRTTFSIKEDQFASGGDRFLVNHKKYYYSVLAYAHNEWMPFDNVTAQGQKTPYLEGRRNIGPVDGVNGYTVIPRPIVDRKLNAEYGDGPVITRLDGVGVGGQFVDVTPETREAMFNGETGGRITYVKGSGPIDVKVYNPLDIVDGEFELTFEDNTSDDLTDARWVLRNLNDPSFELISAETIEQLNEETIAEYGFSVSIAQTEDAGAMTTDENGAIGFDLEYADANGPNWLGAIPAIGPPFNYVGGNNAMNNDPDGGLTNIASGFFYPYKLMDVDLITPNISPAWMNNGNNNANAQNQISSLINVDIVMTSDREKWSRCVVVETANRFYYSDLGIPTEGGAETFDLRAGNSVKRDALEDDGTGTGMGWFPGYAVNVETGKRLNIFFGENSTYDCEAFPVICDDFDGELLTGRDMVWNPNDQFFIPGAGQTIYGALAGGQHFIYVSDTEYDECEELATQLSGNSFTKLNAVKTIKWAGFPRVNNREALLPYDQGLIPNDAVIKLRVDNPYQKEVGTGDNNGLNQYLFSFEGAAPDAADTAEEINRQLDAINVVPNPYYGYSAYETSQFTNTVKITNLPGTCTVTIFTIDGNFVRQYTRDEDREAKDANYAPVLRDQITPALEWDLNNSKGIPVASGVYLIHVDADGLGERVIKWFGVARQFDPTGL